MNFQQQPAASAQADAPAQTQPLNLSAQADAPAQTQPLSPFAQTPPPAAQPARAVQSAQHNAHFAALRRARAKAGSAAQADAAQADAAQTDAARFAAPQSAARFAAPDASSAEPNAAPPAADPNADPNAAALIPAAPPAAPADSDPAADPAALWADPELASALAALREADPAYAAQARELGQYRAQAMEAQFARDLGAIRAAHPDEQAGSVAELGEAYLRLCAAGVEPLVAYEALRADRARRSAQPAGMGDVRGAGEPAQRFYTRAEAAAMSRAEVRRHFDAIRASMREWA